MLTGGKENMQITFVSNYINHHQIPFCEACAGHPGTDFRFIQTMPMEEERIRMGWGLDPHAYPFVACYYEDPEGCTERVMNSDIVLFGWTGLPELEHRRLESGRPVVRVSERIYKEGQWKAVSPKGLISKYREHTRYRSGPYYLLCAGAYVASDFALVHAYPGKMYQWGYFPPVRSYTDEQLLQMKRTDAGGEIRLLWAGRFIAWKHPEFALLLARHLLEKKTAFHLEMVGAGNMEEELHRMAAEYGLGGCVSFSGFLPPERVRERMEQAQIFLFTSNHLEGWGAVVNEAMNSACAVVAGSEAGAVPTLLRQGVNGVIFDGEDAEDFIRKTDWLIEHPDRRHLCGMRAMETIRQTWNAGPAAERFLQFAAHISDPERQPFAVPEDGPMSPAPIVKPFIKVQELV